MNNDRTTWINKGRAGNFNVWHVGKNQYVVTDGVDGEVVAERSQFGLAFTFARQAHEIQEHEAARDDDYEAGVRASYAARGYANVY